MRSVGFKVIETDTTEHYVTATARASADDFGQAVSKVAVAQLCEAAGFHGVKDSALEAFSDVAIQYLVDLGKAAEFYANLAGRSQCSVLDVISGLQDLEQFQGFSGADTVKELMKYVSSKDEFPFAQPIPHFPVIRDRRTIPSFLQMGEVPPSKHIPAWLPAFPDPHTYIHTPVWDERESDPREHKLEQARQRRKAEKSLLSLQKRLLLCTGSVEASISSVPGNGASPGAALQGQGVHEGVDKNPFIKAPANKDVALVPLPLKVLDADVDADHVSVVEAFTLAIEKLKNDGLCEDGQEGKEFLSAGRLTVHFKFRTGKKLIGESLVNRHQKKDASRYAALASREDERDDKKRRAEYIFKQSMENPQELTLL